MTTNNLSKGLLKRLCVQIGFEYTPKLEQLVKAYHQAKCAKNSEPVGYIMQPAFFDNIRRSTICQDKHSSYQIPVFTSPQANPVPDESKPMIKDLCGCGNPIRYETSTGMACNKIARCLTRQELEEKVIELIVQLNILSPLAAPKPIVSDAEAKLKDEIFRLKLKCNQLIGLCKSASGYLFEHAPKKANKISDALIDIEIEQPLEKDRAAFYEVLEGMAKEAGKIYTEGTNVAPK